MSLMRSGVGAAWPLTLDFFLDFEETLFFFLVVVEDVCAVPGLPAADTREAALTRSAAPKIYSKVRLLIVWLSPCEKTKIHFPLPLSSYFSGAGTTPAR